MGSQFYKYLILSYYLSTIYLSIYLFHLSLSRASLVLQLVKNPPAMQETWVQSLGWEDPLEAGTATHSSIWSGEFHGLYSPWDLKKSEMTVQLSLSSTYPSLLIS